MLYENIHSMVYVRREQMFLTCQKCKNTLSWWTASINSCKTVHISKERKYLEVVEKSWILKGAAAVADGGHSTSMHFVFNTILDGAGGITYYIESY